MYKDLLEEITARQRQWTEYPEEAPLDVLSWPISARVRWDALEHVVRGLGGVVAKPRSLLTLDGSWTFFSVDGEILNALKFTSLVRAYPLIYDETPRDGISSNALAVVVVAAFGIHPKPMLLPVLDDRGTETLMLLHGQPPFKLFELRALARPRDQQPASIVQGERMTAPGANIEYVVARVADRLDRDLAFLPHQYGLPSRRPISHSSASPAAMATRVRRSRPGTSPETRPKRKCP